MLVLTLRTDSPQAEIGLYGDDGQLQTEVWEAGRKLSGMIHTKIEELFAWQHKSPDDIGGIVVFQGPGSFTGLRIGLTVANALAVSLGVPIVATQGEDWIIDGLARLRRGETDIQALPLYGAEVHITPQKK